MATCLEDGGETDVMLLYYGRRHKKRPENWTLENTFALIHVWKDNLVAVCSWSKRKHHVYLRMAQQLLLVGVHRSALEVKNKIANLSAEYRRERVRVHKEGGPSKWRFWDAVHDVMVKADARNASLTEFEQESSPLLSHVEVMWTTGAEASRASETEFGEEPSPLSISVEGTSTTGSETSRPLETESAASRLIAPGHCKGFGPLSALHQLDRIQRERNERSYEEEHVVCPPVDPPRPTSPDGPPRCRKRKSHLEEQEEEEDQLMRIVRLAYEENRRLSEARRRAEDKVLSLMRERLDLQRQSLCLEERIERAVEVMCRGMSGLFF